MALNILVGLAGYLAARHGLRQPRGAPRALAAAVLAWTWAMLGMELLGSLGLMRFGPLLGWAAVGLLAALALRAARPAGPDPPRAPGAAWTSEETLAVALVLWGAILLGAGSLLFPVKRISDGPIYHLYFAARWWKEGRLSLIATPFGENAAPYFPANGDLWYAWLMIGWGGDRLARGGQVPFLPVAALAVFALARRLGAGRAASVVATCWFLTCSPFLVFAFEPNVDTMFVAGYLAASCFLLRHGLGDDGRASLLLGGLAAGMALGTKVTAVVFVPPLLALAAWGVVRRARDFRGRLVDLGVLALAPLVASGFWFARNAWLAGNPLYPLRVAAFGRELLPGWYGPGAMRASRYYLDPTDGRALSDLLLVLFDPRLAPVWLAALAGAWAIGRDREDPDRGTWAVSALAALNVALYWLLIPYRTQFRFAFAALGLAAVPLARLLDRGRWLRTLAVALLALHMLTPQGWPWAGTDEEARIPWDLSDRVPNAHVPPIAVPLPPRAVRALGLGAHPVSGAAWAYAALGVAALLTAWTWGRPVAAPSPRRWRTSLAATAAYALLGLLLVYPWGVDRRLLAFPRTMDYSRGWFLLDQIAGPKGARVAYAGTGYPYYLLGSALQNDVRYVNVDAHRDWLMHDYHRAARSKGRPTWPHPRPGWDRARPSYPAWLANLRAAGIQLLFVVRTNPADGWQNEDFDAWFPIERSWADAHPEVFELVPGSDERTFRLYRVRPPASPRARLGRPTAASKLRNAARVSHSAATACAAVPIAQAASTAGAPSPVRMPEASSRGNAPVRAAAWTSS